MKKSTVFVLSKTQKGKEKKDKDSRFVSVGAN